MLLCSNISYCHIIAKNYLSCSHGTPQPPPKKPRAHSAHVILDTDTDSMPASRQSGQLRVRRLMEKPPSPPIHPETLAKAVQCTTTALSKGDNNNNNSNGPKLTPYHLNNGYTMYKYENEPRAPVRDVSNIVVSEGPPAKWAYEVTNRGTTTPIRLHSPELRTATRSALSRSGAQAPTPVQGRARPQSAHPRVLEMSTKPSVVIRSRPQSAHPQVQKVEIAEKPAVLIRSRPQSAHPVLSSSLVKPEVVGKAPETRDFGVNPIAAKEKEALIKMAEEIEKVDPCPPNGSAQRSVRPWSTYENDFHYPKHVGLGTWIDRDGNKIRPPARANPNITMTRSAILRAEANGVNYFKKPTYSYWRMEKYSNVKPTLNTRWSENELQRFDQSKKVKVSLNCPDNSNMTVTLNVKT